MFCAVFRALSVRMRKQRWLVVCHQVNWWSIINWGADRIPVVYGKNSEGLYVEEFPGDFEDSWFYVYDFEIWTRQDSDEGSR